MNAVPTIISSRPPQEMSTIAARPVTLALQGGGALGAFSWGVLDRLLDEPRLRIAVASGASAGAMNAAMLVQGLATGGRAEAKRLLEALWRRVAVAAGSPDFDGVAWLRPFLGAFGPMADALRHAARELPPSRLAPHGPNPLRGVLDGLLDPAVFGTARAPTLVVSATRLRTGEARLFWDAEVSADVLLASACLPQIFPPVDIEGEAYWDGGYASNPPLRPLIEAGAPADVILVPTAPMERLEPPHGAADIRERSAEIAFGTALRLELRSLAMAQRLLAESARAAAAGERAGPVVRGPVARDQCRGGVPCPAGRQRAGYPLGCPGPAARPRTRHRRALARGQPRRCRDAPDAGSHPVRQARRRDPRRRRLSVIRAAVPDVA